MPSSFVTARYARDMIGIAVLAATLVVIGLVVRRSFYLTMMTYSEIYAIAALGMALLFGFAGQISLGQAAFIGVGAYSAAFGVMKLGLPSIVAVVTSIVISAVFGWVVARPLLRLTMNYFAMATLAFGGICYVIFVNAHSVTGGIDPGILSMPPFTVAGYSFESSRSQYALVSVALCLASFAIFNLAHSRVGRALRALRTSEVAAAATGVDVVRYKVAAFSISAALSGLAGSLLAFCQSTFNASLFGVGVSIEVLVMVVIGSVATPWGAIFGAFFITIVPMALEDVERYKLLAYGVIVIVVTTFMPNGLGQAIVSGVVSAIRRVAR